MQFKHSEFMYVALHGNLCYSSATQYLT